MRNLSESSITTDKGSQIYIEAKFDNRHFTDLTTGWCSSGHGFAASAATDPRRLILNVCRCLRDSVVPRKIRRRCEWLPINEYIDRNSNIKKTTNTGILPSLHARWALGIESRRGNHSRHFCGVPGTRLISDLHVDQIICIPPQGLFQQIQWVVPRCFFSPWLMWRLLSPPDNGCLYNQHPKWWIKDHRSWAGAGVKSTIQISQLGFLACQGASF